MTHLLETVRKALEEAQDTHNRFYFGKDCLKIAAALSAITTYMGQTGSCTECERLTRENAGFKDGIRAIARAIVKKDNGVCDTIWVYDCCPIGDHIGGLLDEDIDWNELYDEVNGIKQIEESNG